MRAAKRDHLGIALWDERYDEHGEKRLALMSDLRKAVDNEELALIYQPKVALCGGAEHCVEALVRWQHPARGLVPASEFVPLAEQTGYIRTITRWVLERAIVQCMEWRRHGLPINVSVNISARDLIDGELPAWLKELLEREECSARWLSLEIAESAVVGEPGHAHKNLERLHEMGCKLALDDYRNGLFVAGVSATPPARRAQDRQVVHHGHGGRRRRRAHRPLDDRARAQAGPRRRRRRRRGRGDAGAAARARLRQRAGLPAEPAAGRRRHRVLGQGIGVGAPGAREGVAAKGELAARAGRQPSALPRPDRRESLPRWKALARRQRRCPRSRLPPRRCAITLEGVLSIRQLAKAYAGPRRRAVLSGVDLELAPGDYVAVMGESGIGKSTLLNLVAGLDPPDAGSITLDGVELTTLDDDALTELRRERMGFVFQAFHVLPYLSVGQNVALPLSLIGTADATAARKVAAILGSVGLADRAASMPRELSGGELQRVAIARALVHGPRLVLADEPTGNLDPESAGHVLRLLRDQVKSNRAAGILVTHSRAAAATADRILTLTRDGKLGSESPPVAP